jgi:ketosteroid isomerase-like protein
MSQQNVEIVRSLFEEFNRGDYAAAVDFLHPEANVYPGVAGLDPPGAGSSDHLSGRDEVRGFFEDLGETWDAVTVEFAELIEAVDGTVVSVELWRTRGRDGIEIITPITDVYTLRNGAIVRVDGFLDKADALEAFGLAE